MSTMSQFLGGGVKSVQRGTATLSSFTGGSFGVQTVTVTISSVDPAKSFLLMSTRAVRTGSNSDSPTLYLVEGVLTSATVVTFRREVSSETAGLQSVAWQVVEYV